VSLTLPDILALASAAGPLALVGTLAGGLVNRRRNRVDTAAVVEGSVLRIAGRLDQDVEWLRKQLKEAEVKVDSLSERLDAALERARKAEDEHARTEQTVRRLSEEIERINARTRAPGDSGG
jgi:chromosome segregation ATPase